jgi:hypothetical protein
MIVRNLYLVSVAVTPNETNAPLAVDTDTVLACTVAAQGLQMIAGRRRQIGQSVRRIELTEFSKRYPFNALEASYGFSLVEARRFARSKRPDHISSVYWEALNVNRSDLWQENHKNKGLQRVVGWKVQRVNCD